MTDVTADTADGPQAGSLSFADGFRDILPVQVGVVPVGVTLGALAVERGLPVDQIMTMSGAMFAGASQFVAINLWANPLPFWAIVFSVLAVNFRHVLYSAGMSRKVRHWPAAGKAFGFFFLVDPNYALVELKAGRRLTAAYYAGLTVPMYALWLASTGAGIWFGGLIGSPRAIGLDFVFTAYFVYLIVSFRRRPNALAIVLASGAMALAVYALAGPPWHVITGAVAGVVAAYALAGNSLAGRTA